MLRNIWAPGAHGLLLCAMILLAACHSADSLWRADSADAIHRAEVIKSDNDRRDYRFLVLPNQLKVLLVSDPRTDKSAAALDVHVGSGADPEDYQGLAHFLEHMLFLGTEKYPEAGEYQAFISAHSGDHNAYTSFEHTNYFFDIDPAYLEPALDRFAQFFIAPLFTGEYVDREKNAVHSEYMAKLKDDQRRSMDVFKSLVNPQHPYAKFSVGNLETLADTENKPPLRQQLLDFHDRYYSASIMTLVVLGKESLPELEQMVREKFSAVPNNGRTVETIAEPLFSDDVNSLPIVVSIKPEQEQRTLSIAFPTADEMPFYRQKPLAYIGNILGHEGKGSLLSWLKEKGWAEGLSAGSGLSYRGGTTFNISIRLTREGVANTDSIVTALFQTINRIRQTPEQQWLYEEQQQLAELSFRYQENVAPLHYVTQLASGMHYYTPADVLRGNYVMAQYDAALIDRFLADLVPDNAIVTITAPEVTTDQLSYFYSTPFHVTTASARQQRQWQSAAVNEAITLPAPNPFIPEQLVLKSAAFDADERAVLTAESPRLIQDGPGYRLWYKPDQRFSIPRGSVLVGVWLPEIDDGAEHQAMLRLFTELVSDQLNELSYPAHLAGLSYNIAPENRGFVIQISGYDDKQALLLQSILQSIKVGEFDPDRFENIRRDQIRRLENAVKEQPYRRAIEQLPALMYRKQQSTEALLQAYGDITQDRLRDFHRQLLATTELAMLVHGNYRRAEAEQFSAMLREALLKTAWTGDKVEIAHLDRTDWLLPVRSDYSDAALLLYLQGAEPDKQTRAAFGITSQLLRADFYTRLRTEKQLGYIVTSGAYPLWDVPGIFFLVQSPVAGVGKLQQEIIGYLHEQISLADQLTQQQFDRHRDALILRLMEDPQNLWQQSQRYWQDIEQHYYQFDSRQQLVEALNQLTLEQWRQIFKQQIVNLQRAVWIYSKGGFNSKVPLQGQPVEKAESLKQQFRYYTFP